jgi:hypothetical protein
MGWFCLFWDGESQGGGRGRPPSGVLRWIIEIIVGVSLGIYVKKTRPAGKGRTAFKVVYLSSGKLAFSGRGRIPRSG